MSEDKEADVKNNLHTDEKDSDRSEINPELIFNHQQLIHNKLMEIGFNLNHSQIEIPTNTDQVNKAHNLMESVLHPDSGSLPDWNEEPFYVCIKSPEPNSFDFVTRTVFKPSEKRLSESLTTPSGEKSNIKSEIQKRLTDMSHSQADIVMLAGTARTSDKKGNYELTTLYRLAMAALYKLQTKDKNIDKPLVIASTVRTQNELNPISSSALLTSSFEKLLPPEYFGLTEKVDRKTPTELFIAVIPDDKLETFLEKIKEEFNSLVD